MTKSAFQSATKKWLLCLLAAALSLPAFTLIGMIPGVCSHPQGACFAVGIILMFWVAPVAAVIAGVTRGRGRFAGRAVVCRGIPLGSSADGGYALGPEQAASQPDD